MGRIQPKRRGRKSRERKPVWGHLTKEGLEAHREKFGLSKAAMARTLGVSPACYHAWIAGTHTPSKAKQRQLSDLIHAEPQSPPPLLSQEWPEVPRDHHRPEAKDSTSAYLATYALELLRSGTHRAADIPEMVRELRRAITQ